MPEAIVTGIVVAVLGISIFLTRDSLDNMMDTCQIIFWCSAVIVAWLTYVNARTGILQPIRTEVFKVQLAELQEVQEIFVAKNELELREDISLGQLVTANARLLLDDFCRIVLAERYESASERISVGDGWRPLEPTILAVIQEESWLGDQAKSQDERIKFWQDYSLSGLVIPREYKQGLNRIRGSLSHPFLPNSTKLAIGVYVDQINKYVDILEATLTECAKELPNRYQTSESLRQIRDGTTAETWLFNAVNRRIAAEPTLVRLSSDILKSIREYLQVERLTTS
ncbi:hypothetical protein [Bremerella sp.]|uniref:hypothetical protein n=1 Tax=Bremerella sp. TaxID=2795602 RepID=UPI00391A1DA8